MKTILNIIHCLLCIGSLLHSQTVNHPWSVMDGGGGKSSSSGVTLSSSVGESVAGLSANSSLNLEAGYLAGARILSGTTATLTLQTHSSWNMVSAPFLTSDMRKITLYPGASSFAFAYISGTGYVRKDTLQNGTGYWVRYAGPGSENFFGTTFAPETVNVTTGWNLVGTIPYPALVSDISFIGAAKTSQFYSYDFPSGYYTEDTLKPGLGYWIRVSGSGQMAVTPALAIPPMSSIVTAKEQSTSRETLSSQDDLSLFQKLSVKDAEGQERELYFSGKSVEVDLDRYVLPPLAPDDVLDVRFKSQRIVEMPNTKNGSHREFPIQITGATYPVTIRWEPVSKTANYILEVRTTNKKTQQYSVSEKGSVILKEGEVQNVKIRVSESVIPELPKAFALYQNYPNPFNPSTEIRYDLPKDVQVHLTVYNLLGQEIVTLVDDRKGAGKYAVDFNAADYPSGVYYYRLEAGSFTSIKKMLLLK